MNMHMHRNRAEALTASLPHMPASLRKIVRAYSLLIAALLGIFAAPMLIGSAAILGQGAATLGWLQLSASAVAVLAVVMGE